MVVIYQKIIVFSLVIMDIVFTLTSNKDLLLDYIS